MEIIAAVFAALVSPLRSILQFVLVWRLLNLAAGTDSEVEFEGKLLTAKVKFGTHLRSSPSRPAEAGTNELGAEAVSRGLPKTI